MDNGIQRTLMKHEAAIQGLSAAVSQQAKKEAEATQRKVVDLLSEVQGRLIDRAAAYTNLILLGGYAGLFAIWSATKAALPLKANIAVAAALALSLAIFLGFEVYKMVYAGTRFLSIRKTLTEPGTLQEVAKRLEQLKRDEAKMPVGYVRIWLAVLAICVISAVVALGLLGYNFAAVLLELPMWPK